MARTETLNRVSTLNVNKRAMAYAAEKSWHGGSNFISQKTLDRLADEEYARRTSGGYIGAACSKCFIVPCRNGACGCSS